MSNIEQKHFKQFKSSVELAISKYTDIDNTKLLVQQREQIRMLLVLEKKWKKELLAHKWGPSVYQKFIEYIRDVRRSILVASPFFRERQSLFKKHISGALKKRKEKALYKWNVNYYFVLFALKQYKWPPKSEVVKIAHEIEAVRRKILELNLPLAIAQARVFYGCTPKSHLTWMDLVQIHCGGLLVAIDKFVPPDDRKMTESESLQAYRSFRAVAIGRMISDRIDSYSETMLHFYPIDRKKLYRAHKLLRTFKAEEVDYSRLAILVNEGVELSSQLTTATEIRSLLAGASTVSGETTFEGDDGESSTILERYHLPTEDRPETAIEDLQALAKIKTVAAGFSVLDRKIIQLKGIALEILQ